MVVRERSANVRLSQSDEHDHVTPVEDYTQVAVLEDGVLVEHFVTTEAPALYEPVTVSEHIAHGFLSLAAQVSDEARLAIADAVIDTST